MEVVMPKAFRKRLIAFVTFVSGLYFFLEFVLPEKIGSFKFGAFHQEISWGFVAVGSMAIGLGLINILVVHGGKILRTQKNWGNSLALLLGLIIMLIVEGGSFLNSESRVASWQRIESWRLFSQKVRSDQSLREANSSSRIEALIHEIDATISEAESGGSYLSFEKKDGEDIRNKLVDSLKSKLGEVKVSAVELGQGYRKLSGETSVEDEDIAFRDGVRAQLSMVALHEKFEAKTAETVPIARDLSQIIYDTGLNQKFLVILRNGIFFPLGSAMFSLLAFYIATAAYRSFRLKSLEASIMMLAAVLVILGQIPHGPTYIWSGLPALRLWMLENLSTPAFRAIYFGIMVAGLAMAVRMWLSLDKSPLALDEE
jgi:hypothetical protein